MLKPHARTHTNPTPNFFCPILGGGGGELINDLIHRQARHESEGKLI